MLVALTNGNLFADDLFCNTVLKPYEGPKPWPSWLQKVDESVTRFVYRNFGNLFGLNITPASMVPAMEKGRWISMSEYGESYAYSDKITDFNFFIITTAVSAYKLVNANNAISSTKNTVKLNSGSQGKHIVNHPNYMEGRSILYGDIDDAQVLLNKYAGTGQKINEHKERVNFGKVIGVYINSETSEAFETTKGIIHYGDKGAHIIPSRP